ncbi:hypothetical protein OG979_28820 [Actinomadura citrea]|uniref:hypothetical protein n=1 Tax=Actinomadura citrea TaxID=46158 RepID=UPI002E2D530F|nr:hypothetical protein [Actinomadura citrea]
MNPGRHGRSWWPWLVAAVTVTMLLGLVAVTFEPLGRKDGLQIAANRAQLTGGLLIAAAIPAMAVVIWAHRRSLQARTVTVPTTDALEHAKEVLARVVAWQWKREAELRLLDDPDPIPVRWKLTDRPGLMDHPATSNPHPHRAFFIRCSGGPLAPTLRPWLAGSGSYRDAASRFWAAQA